MTWRWLRRLLTPRAVIEGAVAEILDSILWGLGWSAEVGRLAFEMTRLALATLLSKVNA